VLRLVARAEQRLVLTGIGGAGVATLAARPMRRVAAFPAGEDRGGSPPIGRESRDRAATHRPGEPRQSCHPSVAEPGRKRPYGPGLKVRAASAKAAMVCGQEAAGAAAMSSYGRPVPGAVTRVTTTRASITPAPGGR